MADDLDALFGAFDGGGPENEAENDAVRSDEGSGDDKPAHITDWVLGTATASRDTLALAT